ncbi:hypothetical protein, partial [Caballeronia sp.]|uniref:hypothetical protein n=1 Tax=Caballeronia sp. TaxID=1931223 RepID=UPI003C61BD23
RVKYLGPRYVRAKNLKWATTTLRYSRFERVSLLRFFARLQRNEVPPRTGANRNKQENTT